MVHIKASIARGVVSAALALVTQGTSQADVSSGKIYNIQEQRLGQAHDEFYNHAISADGCHFAYFLPSGDNKSLLVVDGQTGPEYDATASLTFSPDGSRLAYSAKKGAKWFVVVDGEPGPEYDGIIKGGPVFSLDSKHMAYASFNRAEADRLFVERFFLVLDGHAEPTSRIFGSFLTLSGDGKRVAYVVDRGNMKYSVVVGGEVGPKYDGAAGLTFSPDGDRFAYVAGSGDKGIVVSDGQPGTAYDAVGGLTFSPDGNHIVYAARQGQKWFMVVDGRPGPDYEAIGGSGAVFSADGSRFAYSAKKGTNWVVVVEGQPSTEYDGIGSLVFSPDGKHLAYLVKDGPKLTMILDGQAGAAYDDIGKPHFSPDGKHIAYLAKRGAKFVVVLDEQPGPDYEAVRKLAFSPDSGDLAYSAKKGNNWVVVVSGRSGPEYDGIVENGPTFHADGVMEYLAIRDKALYRVRHVPVRR